MDTINWVIQLFEYQQLPALIKLIEWMQQIFVNTPLKFLLHIYEESILVKLQVAS